MERDTEWGRVNAERLNFTYLIYKYGIVLYIVAGFSLNSKNWYKNSSKRINSWEQIILKNHSDGKYIVSNNTFCTYYIIKTVPNDRQIWSGTDSNRVKHFMLIKGVFSINWWVMRQLVTQKKKVLCFTSYTKISLRGIKMFYVIRKHRKIFILFMSALTLIKGEKQSIKWTDNFMKKLLKMAHVKQFRKLK